MHHPSFSSTLVRCLPYASPKPTLPVPRLDPPSQSARAILNHSERDRQHHSDNGGPLSIQLHHLRPILVLKLGPKTRPDNQQTEYCPVRVDLWAALTIVCGWMTRKIDDGDGVPTDNVS